MFGIKLKFTWNINTLEENNVGFEIKNPYKNCILQCRYKSDKMLKCELNIFRFKYHLHRFIIIYYTAKGIYF